jgi:hypothetical protein
MNLVSLVKQFLTPDIINRIATALGLDRYTTQTAIGAAVPGLLAGLLGVAQQPGGAQRVADAVNQQASSGVLGNFANALGQPGQSSLIDKGSSMLGSLFGGGQNALASAVGKFSGLGQGESSSLLGMLAPLVMGTIGQSQGARVDAGGISSLLANQKNNIMSAMPSGFASMLGGAGGVFDSISSSLTGAAQKVGSAANDGMRSAAYAARDASQDLRDGARRAAAEMEAQASAMPNWLYWAIPLIALTALAIFLFMRPTEQGLNRASTVPNVLIDRGDITQQVSDSITGLHSTLGDIKDADSARAALPVLQQLNAQLGQVGIRRNQLTAEQRRHIAGVVNPSLPALDSSFDRVLAVPGAPDDLKPTIDSLRAKLAALGA